MEVVEGLVYCLTSPCGLISTTWTPSPEPQEDWFFQTRSVGGLELTPASDAQTCTQQTQLQEGSESLKVILIFATVFPLHIHRTLHS